jgi:hypothetical protein
MLAPTDIRTLTAWCHRRAMRWQPLRVDADGAALLLEPLAALRPWQRMRLLATDHGYRLEDEAGQPLASASALPALLDALDGGVADAAPLVLLRPRRAVEEAAFA